MDDEGAHGDAGDQPAVVQLVDEDGLRHSFLLHDALDYEGVTYYLVEAVAGGDQVLLLREGASGLESVHGEEFDRVIELLEVAG